MSLITTARLFLLSLLIASWPTLAQQQINLTTAKNAHLVTLH